MSSYLIPAEETVFEETIKNSRFITRIQHCAGMAEAKTYVEQIKAIHKDARHNCWAFVAGAPGDSMTFGFSDDGEPSGTAGKPMLAQLSGSDIGEIVAVTTRYSGGIKLGTGGLVKAYGGGVNKALQQLVTTEKVLTTRMQYTVPFEWQNLLETTCQQLGATIEERHYDTHLQVTLACPDTLKAELAQRLTHGSKGQILTPQNRSDAV